MKITLTGSLGNITQPLAKTLIGNGHDVTIISSNPDRSEAIRSLGATPAIGSVADADFLTEAFKNADALYTMVPPSFSATDYRSYIARTGRNYVQAIRNAGVKKVVNLSSIGAHLPGGTGPIAGLHDVEQLYKDLQDVAIVHLRAGYFYNNFYGNIDMVKQGNILGANYDAQTRLVLVHPDDIAAVAAAQLQSDLSGQQVVYVASEDAYTASDVSTAIGEAIGKPDLPWVAFSDEDAFQGMIQAGLPDEIAKNYVEMGSAMQSGALYEHYFNNKPSTLGTTKLKDFATAFAAAYKQS